MCIQESWLIENRIILIHTEGNVSLADVKASNERLYLMLNTVSAPVHIIFDGTHMQSHPLNVIELKQTLTFLEHENIGWMVTVSMNSIITFMNSVIAKLFGIQMLTAQTVDLALESLERIDSTLPSVKAN